jgi:hypothetical protein
MTEEAVKEARRWLDECAIAGCFSDLDEGDIWDEAQYPDRAVWRAISRQYSGGIPSFLASLN